MDEVSRASTSETLEYLHGELDGHFRALHKRRQELDPPAAVFALEHGLAGDDLALLQDAVRSAHRERLLSRVGGRWWLPFVAHAAEVGYVYDGVEYWPIYAKATPGWVDSEYERNRVRDWFLKFAREYGGAIPQGAWADTFRKIARVCQAKRPSGTHARSRPVPTTRPRIKSHGTVHNKPARSKRVRPQRRRPMPWTISAATSRSVTRPAR